jgi:hypothetical protein
MEITFNLKGDPMKFFNKIAVCTLVATMMVAQAQAIELVKVEPVAKFLITEAAQENLAESMKFNANNMISVKAMLESQKARVNYLSKNKAQTLAKVSSIAE